MKASVQYNDFVGTAAADISDHSDLKKFLERRNVDTNRFNPVGASFYAGYDDLSGSIICIDNEKSTDSKKHLVELSFERDFGKDEFFNCFKRFHVIISREHNGYHNQEIDEEVLIDDRNED